MFQVYNSTIHHLYTACVKLLLFSMYLVSVYNYTSRFHGPSLVHGSQVQAPPPAGQDHECASCKPAALAPGLTPRLILTGPG